LHWIDCVILSLFLQGYSQPLFISVEMAVVHLDRKVCSYCLRSVFLSTDLVSLVLFYIIQETRVLVGLQCRVILGLHDSNITMITWENLSQTRSSPLLAGYPVGLASTEGLGRKKSRKEERDSHLVRLSYLAKSAAIQQYFSFTINQRTVLSATINQRNEQAVSS
jgi:hypothetical protein